MTSTSAVCRDTNISGVTTRAAADLAEISSQVLAGLLNSGDYTAEFVEPEAPVVRESLRCASHRRSSPPGTSSTVRA